MDRVHQCLRCRAEDNLAEISIRLPGRAKWTFYACEVCWGAVTTDFNDSQACGRQKSAPTTPPPVRRWTVRFKCWLGEFTMRYFRRNGKRE